MAEVEPRGPREILEAFVLAYNDHDTDAVSALYADDAIFEVADMVSVEGREAIRRIIDYDIALNLQMLITNMNAQDDSATCVVRETNDWLRTAGIEEGRYLATFEFENGLIKSLRAEAEPESARRILQVLKSFADWASKERSERFEELIHEGEFDYSRETAKRFLALLREWRETTQAE